MIGKSGQTGMFFLFMIAIVLFILGFGLASTLVTNSTQVRSNMDCSNVSIDTSQKIGCTLIDLSSPFLIGILLAIGGIVFSAKLLQG